MSATTRWHKASFSALFALFLIGGPGISGAKAGVVGDLGGDWWVWAFDTEFSQFDFDGDGSVDCSDGQGGTTWFLAGTFGTPSVRTCDAPIPAGTSLFFPLVNQLIFFEDGVDPPEFDLSLGDKRLFLDGRIGGGSLTDDPELAALTELIGRGFRSAQGCDLHATLDGEAIALTTPIVREQSSPVTITNDPEALADGFYVLLEPLEAGTHVLEFGGAMCDVLGLGHRFFETTVIYNISVDE